MVLQKKQKKILFFSRYPIEFEVIPFAGFRNVIDNLAKKYTLSYLSMGWSKGKSDKLRSGIDFKELPMKIDISSSVDKWFKTIIYYMLLPYSLVKIKRENPDIILCRENMPFVPLTLGLLNKPVLIEIGDWWPSMILGSTPFGKKIANAIENFEVRLWNKGNYQTIAHNYSEKKVMLEKGISANQVKIVTMPMFGDNYFPTPAKKERLDLGFKEGDFVVATHGIIHKSKGYDQVLSWWAKLVKVHPDWKFLFIGGTMGEDWFRKMIDRLNLNSSVKVTGWVSDQNKLNKYLNAADCLLITRRNTKDNLGTTPSGLTHSLMTGKPTVVTGMPSIHELITDRKNGYLFEPDNYDSFKKALEAVYTDRKESKKVGILGLKRVKEYFDAKKCADEYDDIIKNLLKKN